MRKQNAPDENKFSCREAIVAWESKDESEELLADKLISASRGRIRCRGLHVGIAHKRQDCRLKVAESAREHSKGSNHEKNYQARLRRRGERPSRDRVFFYLRTSTSRFKPTMLEESAHSLELLPPGF